MTKRQPPDGVRARDIINGSIDRYFRTSRVRRLAPAASAARAVAMAAGRADDATYVSYLTALSEMTGTSAGEQRAGVRRMAMVAADPEHRERALHALRELVRANTAPGRLAPDALALARRALAHYHPQAVPHSTDEMGKNPDSPARSFTEGPGGPPRLPGGVRILTGAVRREPRVFVVATIGAIAFSLMPVALVALVHLVVDRLWLPAIRTGEVDTRMAWGTAVACILLFIVRAGGLFAGQVGGAAMRQRLQGAEQRQVVDDYVEAPAPWHDRHRPRDLVDTAERSGENTWRAVAPLPFAVGGVVTLLAAVGALAAIDWWLAGIGLAVVVGLGGLSVVSLRWMGPHAGTASAQREQVLNLADRTAKTGGGTAPGDSRPDPVPAFRKASVALARTMTRLRKRRGLYRPLSGAIPIGGVLFAIAVAGWNPPPDGIAGLISAVLLVVMLRAPVIAIGSVVADLPRVRRGGEPARPVDERRPQPEPTVATVAYRPPPACPELDRLKNQAAWADLGRCDDDPERGHRSSRLRLRRPVALAEKMRSFP